MIPLIQDVLLPNIRKLKSSKSFIRIDLFCCFFSTFTSPFRFSSSFNLTYFESRFDGNFILTYLRNDASLRDKLKLDSTNCMRPLNNDGVIRKHNHK